LKPELFKKQPYYRPGCDSFILFAGFTMRRFRLNGLTPILDDI
ncbi:MAG: hypothetical protein ACJASV_000885, partial [Pseudorhodobacter sp.]